VIEKRAGASLAGQDVFVNVTGGFRLDEPGADLAVLLAIVSSRRNTPVRRGVVAVGEVGLAGEVRAVSQISKRLAEAARMGFDCALIPRAADVEEREARGIRIVRVAHVNEALEHALGPSERRARAARPVPVEDPF
jgi:DNA repair protein RadA/Sms